jgi:hypothetical protein
MDAGREMRTKIGGEEPIMVPLNVRNAPLLSA